MHIKEHVEEGDGAPKPAPAIKPKSSQENSFYKTILLWDNNGDILDFLISII